MMNRDEIYTALQDILVSEFEVLEEDISLDSNLYQDLDLDSIDAVDLVVKLQQLTGKKIQPNDFKSARTIADVIDALEQLVSDAA
ncbi:MULTISPECIES: acyl carrier protein [unclassified Agarivorans]|uniref:acyl carrier protein n=1 Tax=unclassified Agarivorans TaxID=2636026 RepID=UPI0026E368EA|nr:MULTISPECIES: acyl carrier protein [unclassified Agarivorans]MDO6685297.1 acyl carrier protein [Agarivorans sp. 3_MG-2023]MDO6715531.1 acyl carrier protein [Agarivorans sp. 2_MG-2023]